MIKFNQKINIQQHDIDLFTDKLVSGGLHENTPK